MALLTTFEGSKLARFSDEALEIFNGDKVVLKLKKSGEIYIKEKLVDVDVEVLYGIRELLKSIERGNTTEVE
jgi:hypothetical protein